MNSQAPRRGLRLIGIGLTLALLAAGLWGWQLARGVAAVQARVVALEAAGFEPARWPALCAEAAGLSADVQRLGTTAGPLPALGPWLAWLPRYGPLLAASGPLLEAAGQLGSAARLGCAELDRLSAAVPDGQPASVVLVQRLAAARPGLEQARAALDAAEMALASLDGPRLGPPLAEPLARLVALLPRARVALDVALIAPGLLGADGPRSYLLVVQNPDELRPTGGFLSAAGLLRLENGRPSAFSLRDSASYDNLAAAYPLAPDPIRRYMLEQPMAEGLWLFRDANWSPDFPTAAQQMLDLFALDQPDARSANGVVAVTPDAVRLALAALGPLAIEGSSTPVDAGNIEQQLRVAYNDAVAQGRGEERKSFVERLGTAMLQRAEGLSLAQLIALGGAAETALNTRAAQIALSANDPAAALLAAQGWDGAVRPGQRDFLMVVSANVGYNKVGPNVEQRISYTVDLSDPAVPRAAVTVTHTNRSPAADPGCNPRAGGLDYESRLQGCYWDYLRVLVPGAAALSDSDVPVVPNSWVLSGEGDRGRVYIERGPADTRVFGALQVVPRAATQALTFHYDLPPTVLQAAHGLWGYQLRLQRQAGIVQRVTVQVLLPPGAELVGANVMPGSRAGQIFSFELPLETDQLLDLRFRMP